MLAFAKITNKIIRGLMIFMTVSAVSIAGFIVWDNYQVYHTADNVRLEMLELKPQTEDGMTYSFEELLAINPDVNSWITMDGTAIDYPVVRGKDNWYYLNRDVFRKYALAGSIYMDSRNQPDYSDIYTILYGHHMENHMMFSDLDLYKDEEFFKTNTTGTLLLPDSSKALKTVAILEATETVVEIFNPAKYKQDLTQLCKYLRENAILISEETLSMLEANPDHYQAIALVTCTAGITGNRTILIVITPRIPDQPDPIDPTEPTDPTDPTDPTKPIKPTPDDDNPHTGDPRTLLPWLALLLTSLIGIVVTTCIYHKSKKK